LESGSISVKAGLVRSKTVDQISADSGFGHWHLQWDIAWIIITTRGNMMTNTGCRRSIIPKARQKSL